MSVQSHIEWMLLSAAKSILQIMSNQSGEDTATEEALSLTQRLLLSACRGLTDLGTSTAWMNSNFILRERDAYLKKISSNVIQSDIQSLMSQRSTRLKIIFILTFKHQCLLWPYPCLPSNLVSGHDLAPLIPSNDLQLLLQ